MMGGWGRGMMGGGSGAYRPMNDAMVKALADRVGLTPEEVQKRL